MYYNVKLIVSDIDGTLHGPTKTINPVTKKAFNDCINNNIHVVLATGRGWCNDLKNICIELGLKDYIITGNGTTIVDIKNNYNPICIGSVIPKEVVYDFFKVAELIKRQLIVVNDQNELYAWYFGEDEKLDTNNDIGYLSSGINIEKYHDLSLVNIVKDMNIIHIAIKAEPSLIDQYRTYFDHYDLKKQATITVIGKNSIEADGYGISKQTGIDYIQHQFGISKKDTCVFGDSLNDVVMFKNAGVSCAMKDANDELIKIANHELDNPETSTIGDFIYKNILNKS